MKEESSSFNGEELSISYITKKSCDSLKLVYQSRTQRYYLSPGRKAVNLTPGARGKVRARRTLQIVSVRPGLYL